MRDKLGDRIRLEHILLAISEIENYTAGVTQEEFATNSMMYNATLRQLEIIGEASNRLSKEITQENTAIPWSSIIGLRNLVIHEYFGIDDMAIWNIVQFDLPDLKKKIKSLLQKIS